MRMRIGALGRYLAWQNLFLLVVSLGAGVGVYMLSDVFDRLDDFVDAGVGLKTILVYFAVKVPVIVTQILPAVFLVAMVVQLGLLARNREMLALRASGVPMHWFIGFFVFYALAWGAIELGFSQYIGVIGEAEANRIWKEDVRGKSIDQEVVRDIWFRDGPYIVYATEALPSQSRARDIIAYEFDMEKQLLLRIITAKKALVDENGWGLLEVSLIDAQRFNVEYQDTFFIPVRLEMEAFLYMSRQSDQADPSLARLSQVISQLEVSGSNVEALRTKWHGKISYAFSLVALALVALALLTYSENMYVNVALALAVVFAHYGVHVVAESAGTKGLVPPVVAAWAANLIFSALAGIRLAWFYSSRFERRMRALFGWLAVLWPRRGAPA